VRKLVSGSKHRTFTTDAAATSIHTDYIIYCIVLHQCHCANQLSSRVNVVIIEQVRKIVRSSKHHTFTINIAAEAVTTTTTIHTDTHTASHYIALHKAIYEHWTKAIHTSNIHPCNGLLSRTTWISQYQKGKTSLDFNEARYDGGFGMQWH